MSNDEFNIARARPSRHDMAMGERVAVARRERIWFWTLLAVAIALRAIQFDPYAMHHPDEVLQYLEPAYRLVSGEGIVTWEYRYGMRGWLFPWLLAGPMALGQAIGGSAFAGIVAARIAAAAVGLIPVIAAWHLGRRVSATHGIVAMAVMAVWFEQIVFSTHVLTETMATSLFLGAAALIEPKAGRSRVMLGGGMLALAGLLRFHYGLAVVVFLLLALGTDWKRWAWVILGGLPVLLLSGTVDLMMGQWPFEWVWVNIQQNVIAGRASAFGVEPAEFYVTTLWSIWGFLAIPILIFAVEAGKSYRPILFAAVINFAAHGLIPHKEYRFIELSIAAILLLAAIGSVNVWRSIERRQGKLLPALPTLVAIILAWAAASAWLGRDRPLDQWFGERGSGQELAYIAGRDPRVCAVATMTFEFWQLSRAYLGRPMPIYLLDQVKRPRANLTPLGPEQTSFNAVVAPRPAAAILPGYDRVKCKGPEPFSRCLYIRPGSCTPTPGASAKEIQKVMLAHDL